MIGPGRTALTNQGDQRGHRRAGIRVSGQIWRCYLLLRDDLSPNELGTLFVS